MTGQEVTLEERREIIRIARATFRHGLLTLVDLEHEVAAATGLRYSSWQLLRALPAEEFGIVDAWIRFEETGAGRDSAKGANALLGEVIEVPSLVRKLLRRLGVQTLKDLQELDLDQLAHSKGVGRKKLRVISEMARTARAMDASEVSLGDDDTDPTDTSFRSSVQEESWKHCLTGLSTRTRGGLERAGLRTLHELDQLLTSGEPLPGLGPKSIDEVRQQLDSLYRVGRNQYLFALDEAPAHYVALVNAFLERSEHGDWFRAIYIEDATYTDLAERNDVGESRIFHALERELKLATAYGVTARQLLTSEIEDLVRYPPILVVDSPADIRYLRLALDLAGHDVKVWYDGIVTGLQRAELDALLLEMARGVEENVESPIAAWDHAAVVLQSRGIRLRPDELRTLVKSTPGWRWCDEGILLNDPLGVSLTEELALSPTPISVTELLRARTASGPGAERVELSRARAALLAQPGVWRVERGKYLHRSRLSLTEDDIAAHAQQALRRLEGNPNAVAAEDLVVQLGSPEGLTPVLLMDAIGRHSKGVSLGNSHFVAHRDSFEDPGTLAEEVHNQAARAGRALTGDEVETLVGSVRPEGLKSIYYALVTSDEMLLMGRNQWAHCTVLGLEAGDVRDIVAEITRRVPEDGSPVSLNSLQTILPSHLRWDQVPGAGPRDLLRALFRQVDGTEVDHDSVRAL